MIYYLKGKISNVFNEKIVIDVKDVGYDVFVSHPNDYVEGSLRKVFIYQHIHEDERYLVGFETLEEKRMFLLLIGVNGLGPKTAISMLRSAPYDEIYNAILSNNVNFLRKLPNVGNKGAAQIILDLRTRLTGKKGNPKLYSEVEDALKELGYKKKDIDAVLTEINEPNASSEEILKIALTKLGSK